VIVNKRAQYDEHVTSDPDNPRYERKMVDHRDLDTVEHLAGDDKSGGLNWTLHIFG
jgi:hypothetical protein